MIVFFYLRTTISSMTNIQSDLFSMQDKKYGDFSAKLMPNLQSENVIGVRTPMLRKYARDLPKDIADEFINTLPHQYFEENQLHAFIISNIKDFDKCIANVDKFLPFVNNWATCDQLLPKVFAKNTDKLLPYIKRWLQSKHTFTVRFAIGQLMRFYLGDKFDKKYADMVTKVKSKEYYINMMRAWYFATALAKNYEDILPYIKNKKLDDWTHNKSIQKAIESFRITNDKKTTLRKMKTQSC